MGVYNKGINGPFLGRTGSIIGSRWRKINYIKGFSRISYKAPSEKQVLQRTRFRIMTHFLAGVRPVLDLGYNREDTGRKSAYHIAMSYHMKWAFKEDSGLPEIDFSKVVMSKGNLPKTPDIRVRCDAEEGLVISWPTELRNPFISGEDEVTVLIYFERWQTWKIPRKKGKRSEGGIRFAPLQDWVKGPTHCYIYFSSWNGHNSPSQYLGVVSRPDGDEG